MNSMANHILLLMLWEIDTAFHCIQKAFLSPPHHRCTSALLLPVTTPVPERIDSLTVNSIFLCHFFYRFICFPIIAVRHKSSPLLFTTPVYPLIVKKLFGHTTKILPLYLSIIDNKNLLQGCLSSYQISIPFSYSIHIFLITCVSCTYIVM